MPVNCTTQLHVLTHVSLCNESARGLVGSHLAPVMVSTMAWHTCERQSKEEKRRSVAKKTEIDPSMHAKNGTTNCTRALWDPIRLL